MLRAQDGDTSKAGAVNQAADQISNVVIATGSLRQ